MKTRCAIAVVFLMTVVLYFCLVLHIRGQAFTPLRPFILQSSGSNSIIITNPSYIPGIAYWWVATDTLTNQGTNVAITNWIDRIQGLMWTNETAGARPMNSETDGIVFDGSVWMTNSGMVITNHTGPSAAMFICRRTAQNALVQGILYNFDLHNGYGYQNGSLGSASWLFQAPANIGLSGPLATNLWECLLLNDVGSGTGGSSWTNGVLCRGNFGFGAAWIATNLVGGTGEAGRYLVGNIQEIAIYTNYIGTNVNDLSNWASILNHYATNTYKYVP